MLGGGGSRLFLGPPEINFCRRHLDRARDGETGLLRSEGETDIRRGENNISLSPRSVNPVSLAICSVQNNPLLGLFFPPISPIEKAKQQLFS